MTPPKMVWDCSVSIAMAFEDERDDYIQRVFHTVSLEGALVPTHWPMEMVNGLRMAERRKRIESADSRKHLALVATFPIQIDGSIATVQNMLELYESSETYKLTSYDAAYLRLAQTSGLPLASKDDDLKAAALKAGVNLFA